MNVGLLYYNPNPSLSLADRVKNAAYHYRDKYDNSWPDTCYVHPCTLGDRPDGLRVEMVEDTGTRYQEQVEGCVVRVLPSAIVARDYFWIGQKEQE